MNDYNSLVAKYPHLKTELEMARDLQETSASLQAKALYKQKQSEINALIPQLIEHAKVWDENKIRYTITKMEILRDEIMSIEHNSRAFDSLAEQKARGDFDNQTDIDE
mgnify:FL=1